MPTPAKLVIGVSVVVLFIAFKFLGEEVNYRLRSRILQGDTVTVLATLQEVHTSRIPKGGSQTFLMVHLAGESRETVRGLPLSYLKRDLPDFSPIGMRNSETLEVRSLNRGEAEVTYSKRFPSFFKINL